MAGIYVSAETNDVSLEDVAARPQGKPWKNHRETIGKMVVSLDFMGFTGD